MADISKITLPNGDQYNLKDATARSQSGVTGVKGNAESSYRTGQVNITPDNIGAVSKTAEMLTTNPFRPNSMVGPYISKIDNAFYAADKRWTVSAVKSASGGNNTIASLFNGDYESSYGPKDGATATITIDFTGSGWSYSGVECFPNYPYGYILLSFYYTEIPAAVTGRVYCNYASQGVGWHDLTFSPMADNTTNNCVYRARQSYYAISKIEITITARDSGLTSCTQIEMHLDRPYSGRNPFLSKYAAETLYYKLTAPKFIGALEGNVTGNCSGTASNVTGTVAIANGGTGKTTAAEAWTALGGGAIGKKASLVASDIPAHAASATTYGAGDGSNYGHVKLSAATNSSSGTSGGIAATPSAVKAAYDLAHDANEGVGTLASLVTNGVYFTTEYEIANGVATFHAYVYLCGDDVTDSYADADFEWYYRIGQSASTVSLGTGKSKAVTLASLGYGGSVGCIFDDGYEGSE